MAEKETGSVVEAEDAVQAADHKFKEGDEVAWEQAEAARHAKGSILRKDALAEGARVGHVVGVANDEGTWFAVDFGDSDPVVLTHEEIVKVADE